jgi:hypothetical protein
VGFALVSLSLGCGTHLTFAPQALPPAAPAASASLPLLLELVDARKDGFPQSVDESLANRVAMDFRQTGAFTHVFEPIDAHRAPRDAVRAIMVIETKEDPHALATGTKAFLTGMSVFLLAPVFRYDFDAELAAEATLRTCDGWTKRFASRASGSLRSTLFTGEDRNETALRAGVLERALAPLIAEIARDPELHARAGTARALCLAAAR